MKNYIYVLLMLFWTNSIFSTSTSSTSRGVNIDGNVTDQKSASNGSNGTSWESNESLSGKSSVTWYMSWDNTNLYIGREGGNNSEPILIYIQAAFSGASYTDNSSGVSYDGTTGNFPTSGSPNWASSGGVNFLAYLKSSYDEYRTYSGSWSSGNTSLVPLFQTVSSTANMEVTIPWNSITGGNGKPTDFRIIFFHTNGTNSGSGAYVYGASPNSANTPTDGNQATATFRDWWGWNPVISGVSPSGNQGALPVELTSFSASAINKVVKLKWNTATEVNNYGFDIERASFINSKSNGEIIWSKIGFVQGNGNSNSSIDYSFIDDNVGYGKYKYRLKQIDNDGKFEYSKVIEVDVTNSLDFKLEQNYPNPFNPTTTINYQIPANSFIKLKIYNLLGQEIKTLVNGYKEAGSYSIEFKSKGIQSGLYFYKLEANNSIQVRKMMILK